MGTIFIQTIVMMVMNIIVKTVMYIYEIINSGARKAMLKFCTTDHHYNMKCNVHLLTDLLSEGCCAILKTETPLFFYSAETAFFLEILEGINFH